MNGPFSTLNDLSIMPVKEFYAESNGDYLVLIDTDGDCLFEFPVGIDQETALTLVRKLHDVWTQGFKRGQGALQYKLRLLLGVD